MLSLAIKLDARDVLGEWIHIMADEKDSSVEVRPGLDGHYRGGKVIARACVTPHGRMLRLTAYSGDDRSARAENVDVIAFRISLARTTDLPRG